MLKQKTIRNPIKAFGVGIHTGKKIYIELFPAPINTGIIFIRKDIDQQIEIKASAENVCENILSSCLQKDGIRVLTIEHLMSAFAGLGIDNIIVHVYGEEIPIMDGGASQFVFLIQSAGIEEQNANKKFIKIKQSIEVSLADKFVKIEPYDGFKISFTIEFNHQYFDKPQSITVDFSKVSFVKDISRARTFGFLSEFKELLSKNLAKGCNLDNVIAINDDGIENEGGLRYVDEFVRHKILDAMGDLYLLGHPILGHFIGYKSGHALNSKLLHKIIDTKQSFEIVELGDGSGKTAFE